MKKRFFTFILVIFFFISFFPNLSIAAEDSISLPEQQAEAAVSEKFGTAEPSIGSEIDPGDSPLEKELADSVDAPNETKNSTDHVNNEEIGPLPEFLDESIPFTLDPSLFTEEILPEEINFICHFMGKDTSEIVLCDIIYTLQNEPLYK